MRTVKIRETVIGEGMPKICVPITGKSREEIEEETRQVKEMKPDLVEWRADCYEEGKNQEKCLELLKTIRDILGEIPLLFTVRTDKEGGNVQILFEDYVKLLEEAAKTGYADLIDVEVYFEGHDTKNLIRHLQKQNSFVVASNHHFHETPDVEAMLGILREMDQKGADILKLAVIERHLNTGHKGIGFISGIGMKKGAIASSVSHDAHNLIVIGTNDEDMASAANRIRAMGGGNVVVSEGKIIAEMPLPEAGLMSDLSAAEIAAQNEEVRMAVHKLGASAEIEPFMNMAFLSLPVIPSLKMTTLGLVDVNRQRLVSLFEK